MPRAVRSIRSRRRGSRTRFIRDAAVALAFVIASLSYFVWREPPRNLPPIPIPEPTEFTAPTDG